MRARETSHLATPGAAMSMSRSGVRWTAYARRLPPSRILLMDGLDELPGPDTSTRMAALHLLHVSIVRAPLSLSLSLSLPLPLPYYAIPRKRD